ncbi:hypothetical protein HPB50_027381 [Hyalomma asiaticum]|uniref:Uncharacterized protein n=1 Tax=Hyalomma asiaticum TaxID=266040 RepID=A0ACB7TS26_HYAAI|nr:hypothetical protein HPB50_027381 [Hyalomma asiaticum]
MERCLAVDVRAEEAHIISLRRENLRLRLRLYFLVRQDHYEPIENNPDVSAQLTELHNIIDEEIEKISESVKERDALFDRYRRKIEELERLLERAYQDKSKTNKELCERKEMTGGCVPYRDGAQDEKHNSELEGEVKGHGIHEPGDKEVINQKPELENTTKTQELTSVHTAKQEKTGGLPNSPDIMWSSVKPRVQACLQLIEDALAEGDIQWALQAKEDFKTQLSMVQYHQNFTLKHACDFT